MDLDPLSRRLLGSVSRDFFRPLSRPSAAIYIDCADRIADAAGDAGRIPHADAIALVRETLASHPDIPLGEDEGASLRDARQKAGQLFNRLCDSGWLEDQQLGLHERWSLVSPGLRPLLRLLRELAEDEIAELTTFADTVRGVCETLERPEVLDPYFREPDELRAVVTDLNSRLENAVIQLHGVEKLISVFDQRQRASESPAETLRLLYAEFGSGQHMVCYDALRRNGLLPRLQAIRTKVGDARDQPLVKERLAEGLAAHYGWQPDEAYSRGERALRDLERRLASIRLVADAIDARMASFNRLSQQRYNYQTELRGRRPEIVKAYCDAINAAHAGTKLSGFRDVPPDFTPMVPEMRCFYGVESLARTRRVRAAADLSFGVDGGPREDEDDTLEALKERQRLALTPQRAARLVARLLDGVAASIGTETIESASIDDVLDLLATAAYDHATMADGRVLRWAADGPRRVDGLHPENIPMDEQAGDWTIERFTLTRQA
ncbi:Wadjet anti-phage system protein JetA family protein [Haloferula sp. BvORR071]|uniref:Wadjet anti-phage system protein JetA family protein n=1 Tax=Haloferula sp. BvORR071 TaxID=1396141 RepID=UPI00055089DA|nr:Wadjet anti-phage system protein JetA family protein [Haloferula sp. BvORR071]